MNQFQLLSIACIIILIIAVIFITLYAVKSQTSGNVVHPVPVLQPGGLVPSTLIQPFISNNAFPNFDAKKNNNVRVLCIGDSVTEVGSGGLSAAGTYPYQLAAMSSLVGCSEAFMGSHTEARWVVSNQAMISGMTTLAGSVITLTASTDQFTYNATMKSFGYTVWMLTGSTACDVQVILNTTVFGEDGAVAQAPITLSCYNPSQTNLTLTPFEVRSKAALKDSMYLTMTPIPASGRSAMLVGLEPINSDGVNMTVINAGMSGQTTNNVAVADYAYSPINVIKALKPDLSIIMLGINDWYLSKTPLDQFELNMRNIISAAQNGGSGDVLIMTPPPTSVNFVVQSVQDSYVQRIRMICKDLSLPLYDQYGLWQNYSTANKVDWMKDALHPNERGVQQIVNGLRCTLNI